jgi:sirohydrochlorin cobaltochelatase
MSQALILFAHGSRDAGWADPFEQLAARVRAIAHGNEVRLAFLELMRPDLGEAVAQLVDGGASRISIVPIFLGSGGHIRRDLPALIDELRARHPGVEFKGATPAGEDGAVLNAMAAYCAGQLESG